MPSKRRLIGPLAFTDMPDGSSGILVTPADKRRSIVFDVGYIRPSVQGGFIVSTTFEEMQHYEDWRRYPTAEYGVRRMIE